MINLYRAYPKNGRSGTSVVRNMPTKLKNLTVEEVAQEMCEVEEMNDEKEMKQFHN